MAAPPSLYLGASRSLDGQEASALQLPAHHLTTHAVVVGMTGSGKTGLLTVMVEEALRSGVPVIMIDVKGDLPNLFLSLPSFAPEHFKPWLDYVRDAEEGHEAAECNRLAGERARQLGAWQIAEKDLQLFREKTELRLLTPGYSSGELLHILSSL